MSHNRELDTARTSEAAPGVGRSAFRRRSYVISCLCDRITRNSSREV